MSAPELPKKNTPSYILIHCSDVRTGDMREQLYAIDRYHKERDFPKSRLGWYVGYHGIVQNGVFIRTREDDEIGAHCNQLANGMSVNFQSLGICWAGDGDVEFPDEYDKRAIVFQVEKWMKQYGIPLERVVFHREFTPWKTCPGTLITRSWVRDAFDHSVPEPKEPAQQTKQERIMALSRALDGLRALLVQLLQQLKGRN